jgi:hypothetical protein
MAKLVIISGSPSAKSRLNGVLDYAYEALKIHGHQLDRIYVRDLPAEVCCMLDLIVLLLSALKSLWSRLMRF